MPEYDSKPSAGPASAGLPVEKTAGKQTLLVCCALSFFCYIATFMRMPVVPKLALDLGIGAVGIGHINAAYFLTAGLFAFPLGRVSDRLGKKPVALGGLLSLAAGSLILALSATFLQLAAGYILIGLGMAAFGSAMMSLISDIAPAARLGRAYGWFTMTLYAGMSFGPAIGGLLAKEMALSRILLLTALLTLLVVGAAWLFLPSGHSANSTGSPLTAGSATRALLRNRPLLGCLLGTLGACFCMGMFLSFYPLYAYAEGFSISQVGIIFLFHGVGNGLVRVPSGYLSDRIRDRRLPVAFGLVGCSVAMGILGLAGTFVTANLGAASLGLSLGVAFPSLGASIARTVPKSLMGMAMGGFNACIFLGMLVNALFMGPAIETIGFAGCFWLSAIMNGILAGLSLMLMRGTRPREKTKSSSTN
ncbi:MAG: MFS transporter [Syntrophotaleaceae bacterium]